MAAKNLNNIPQSEIYQAMKKANETKENQYVKLNADVSTEFVEQAGYTVGQDQVGNRWIIIRPAPPPPSSTLISSEVSKMLNSL